MEEFQDVPLDEVFCDDEFNSRGHITPASVHELSLDIERNGLMQPIVLQPYVDHFSKKCWRIVMGHRRYMATESLCERRADVPKTIKARLVDALPEHVALVLNLKENMEREPLNILQEARAISRFTKWGWDAKRIAVALGQTKKWAEIRLNLLSLPDPIQRRAEAGWLNHYQIDELANMSTDDDRFARVREIVDHKMKGEKKVGKKRKGHSVLTVLGQGEMRSPKDIYAVQEHLQDAFQDLAHPAASALAWAMGIISTDELWMRAETWASREGKLFRKPKIA